MFMFYMSLFEDEQEKQTFADFYERVQWKGFSVAYESVKDKSTAEDVLHYAFMKIIEHKEKFFSMPCNKQEAYFVIIVKNRANDIHRAAKKQKSLDELDDLGKDIADVDEGVAAAVESEEGFAYLMSLIETLPNKYRAVFELKYVFDMSYDEIAENLDISVSLVGVRLLRARQKLIKLIKEGGYYNGE